MTERPADIDIVEQQILDETRPAKRVRLDASHKITSEVQDEMDDEVDWDEVYEDGPGVALAPSPDTQRNTVFSAAPSVDPISASGHTSLHDALGQGERQSDAAVRIKEEDVSDDMLADVVSSADGLVAPTQALLQNDEKPALDVLEEINQKERQTLPSRLVSQPEEAQITSSNTFAPSNATDILLPDADASSEARPKPTEDPEFMAAAAAQRGNKESEWQYDSSDADSSDTDSSDSDDSSNDSDSGSEGGYEMLDAVTAAKILMSGDGDDDDGDNSKGKKGGDHRPRTTNEIKEEVITKPDVLVTPEMKITLLGVVERAVENMILIKGATPGEFQVLEGGSVLCNENREVIGAVGDTFGRVQEPLYSVAFTNAQEVKDAGLEFGTKVFYVDSHSTFVFTQPLKNLKGTDASNIHDEEVAEDEAEFSDDEAEAEYKRQKKLAKKGGRGGLSRGAFNNGARSFGAPGHDSGQTYISNGSDAPAQTYGSGMSYDDEPAADFYQPLKRPDNLSQLMAGGVPPTNVQQPGSDRGRGRGQGDRGRGRGDRVSGRGDRGRGRRGFEQRGGRGGFRGQQQDASHFKGSAQSFPDRHNSAHSNTHSQHSLPPKPDAPQGTAVPLPPTQHYAPQGQYQQPVPQNYQFQGQTYQYNNQPAAAAPQYNYPQHAHIAQQNLAGSLPSGAYVNPAFFHQQAQQQQQAYPAWTGQQQQQHYPQTYGAQGYAPTPIAAQQQPQPQQPAAAALPHMDLSNILKRLGSGGPPGQ